MHITSFRRLRIGKHACMPPVTAVPLGVALSSPLSCPAWFDRRASSDRGWSALSWSRPRLPFGLDPMEEAADHREIGNQARESRAGLTRTGDSRQDSKEAGEEHVTHEDA